MRRIFTGLLAGVVACFISCDKTEEGNKWFSTPQYVVNGTTVEMSCQTQFGPGVLSASNAGFSYAPVVDGGVVEFKKASGVTVDGSTLHATLSGLAPKTVYVAYAYADLGAGQMQSVGVSFQTGEGGSLPEPDPEKPAFGTPWASDVTASSAMLNCGFTFEEATSSYTLCFEYRPVSGGSYTQKSVPSGSGSKSVLLTGLSASTEYEFRLCCEWDGESYTSDSGRFTTSASQGGGDPLPSGPTKYSGWAELPVEVANSDYYYAYHICSDFRVDDHPARNYTVCYSAEHHCPVWVAAPLHDCYVGGSGNRNYGPDPDIPYSIQPSSKTVDDPYNKGHMLGNKERSKTSGMNKQVSYYTNMAPQHKITFNTGGGAWNNLEDYIDGLWCKDTLYMVSGCLFDTWTDTYGNTATPKRTGFGGVQASVPTAFYYVLLRTKNGETNNSVFQCSASDLQCVGFILSHALPKGHKPQRADMRSVKEIEEMTGFTFFANVPNAPKDTYDPKDWGL